MDKAETQKYVQQLRVEIQDKDELIDSLKTEVEEYKKAFEDAKKERDCQIAEIRLEKDRLEETISQLDSALYTTFGIRHTDFRNHLELMNALEAKLADRAQAINFGQSIDGFDLVLQDFCSYCGDFEPNVEKFNITSFDDSEERYQTNISCKNAEKCARMYGRLKSRVE